MFRSSDHRPRRSRLRLWLGGLAAAALLGPTLPAAADLKVGHNLGSPTFYSSNPAFKNLMHQSLGWCLLRSNGTKLWDQEDRTGKIPQRANDGYPTQVPFTRNNQEYRVHTLIPALYDGNYKMYVSGRGTIRYRVPGVSWQEVDITTNNQEVAFTADGVNLFWEYDSSGVSKRKTVSHIELEIVDSKRWNPINNIRVFGPGDHNASKHAFDSEFLSDISDSYTLRFMDWGRTNNSNLVRWGDRTKKDWYSQATKSGVAYEHMAALANNRGKRLWVNVPHKADNNFITKMAELFRDQVNSGNETIFSQRNWINNRTSGNTLPERYGHLAKNVFNRWDSAFGNDFDSRVIPVLAAEHKNVWQINAALSTAGNKVELISMAPYPGEIFTSVPDPLPSTDDLLEDEYSHWNDVQQYLSDYNWAANQAGLDWVCYEGGPHWLGGRTWVKNNNGLTDRFMDLNRYWKLRSFLRWDFLPQIKSRGAEMYLHFNIGGSPWNQNGAWTTVEYRGQAVGTENWKAQKEWALRNFRTNQ